MRERERECVCVCVRRILEFVCSTADLCTSNFLLKAQDIKVLLVIFKLFFLCSHTPHISFCTNNFFTMSI